MFAVMSRGCKACRTKSHMLVFCSTSSILLVRPSLDSRYCNCVYLVWLRKKKIMGMQSMYRRSGAQHGRCCEWVECWLVENRIRTGREWQRSSPCRGRTSLVSLVDWKSNNTKGRVGCALVVCDNWWHWTATATFCKAVQRPCEGLTHNHVGSFLELCLARRLIFQVYCRIS